MNTSRRHFIASTATAVALAKFAPLSAAESRPRFQIGACDWSIGKTADVAALEVAKQISLDGVQVSLGTLANDMHLRRPEVQQRYKDAARKVGVEVLSLAIGELNNIPYKSDRAHRIGQERPVTVVRLVAQDTIEESVLALHARKRDLAESLLEGANVAGKLSTVELHELIAGQPRT